MISLNVKEFDALKCVRGCICEIRMKHFLNSDLWMRNGAFMKIINDRLNGLIMTKDLSAFQNRNYTNGRLW